MSDDADEHARLVLCRVKNMTNTLPKFLILATLTVTVMGCGSGDTGGSGSSATGGSSGSTGTGGTFVGGSGGVTVGATGGTSPNGGTGNVVGTGGVHPGTGGTISTGGTPGGTGGTITSTGGTSPGTGGSPSCTNTQTDPKNCGTCGHVCGGTCTGGKCDPAFGGCFDRNQFDTCDAFCASIGESCVQAACKTTFTWMSWSAGDEARCGLASAPSTQTRAACADALPVRSSAGSALFNCCCQ